LVLSARMRRETIQPTPPPPAPDSPSRNDNLLDRLCELAILVLTLAVYAPALFGGKVLLPADIVPLMRPWGVTAREHFPDFRFAQNQMHGPIFEYYSWRHYARERIRAGEVPLWNPYELSGNVLLANSQSAVLYPPNLLLYIMPLPAGINMVTALHTFLSGFFLFGLLRALRLRPPAALTGALVWMFCGVQLVWTEFQTPTAALCWLPGMLWAWERFAQTGSGRMAVFGAGGAVAMTLLAGHLHFAFYALLAFCLYALWRSVTPLLQKRSLAPPPFRPLVTLFGVFAFGITLSLCTLLPVMEMGRMNHRAGKTSYASAIGLRLPWENLLTLFQPNLFGNPRDYVSLDAQGKPTSGNSYWGQFNFVEYTAYLGIPALILAGVGVAASFRKTGNAPTTQRPNDPTTQHPARFFAFLAALGLLMALGTPVCLLFFYGVPGYQQFNATARALCLFSFAGAALAAFGAQTLLGATDETRKRVGRMASWSVGVVALVGLAAFPGTALLWKVQDAQGNAVPRLLTDDWLGYSLAGMAHFLVFALLTEFVFWSLLRRSKQAGASIPPPSSFLLPVIAAADLLVWGFGFNPVTEPTMLGYRTETTDFLRRTGVDRTVSLETPGRGIKSFIVPNYNAVAGYREVQGADSLHSRRYHRLIEAAVLSMRPDLGAAFPEPNTVRVPGIQHPLFNLLNVRYLTSEPDVTPPGDQLRRVADTELVIWENPNALGPAWVVSEVGRIETLEDFLAYFKRPDFDARRMAVLEQSLPFLSDSKAVTSSTTRMTAFSPHRLVYQVETTANGLLVMSEPFFPGWRARVDGKPVEMMVADYILRAVPVSPGPHSVEVRYEPTSYRLGLYLTLVAMAVFTGFWGSRKRVPQPQ
jgi:hypothetical protein